MLGALRVATTAQAKALVTPEAASAGYVRRALRVLAADGLVQGTMVGRSHEYVWYLTSAGVRAWAIAEGRDIPRRPPVSAAMVAAAMLQHALAVTATASAFTKAGVGRPADWKLEVDHRYGPGPRQKLRADAVLRAEDGEGWPQALLVEVDRATLSIGRLLGEVRGYRAYTAERVPARGTRIGRVQQNWQRDYVGADRCPPLLFVLTGAKRGVLERRRDRLVDLARQELAHHWRLRHGNLDAGIVLLEDLVTYGPRENIVRALDSNQWVPVDAMPGIGQQ